MKAEADGFEEGEEDGLVERRKSDDEEVQVVVGQVR
jgi:hypothetical protein